MLVNIEYRAMKPILLHLQHLTVHSLLLCFRESDCNVYQAANDILEQNTYSHGIQGTVSFLQLGQSSVVKFLPKMQNHETILGMFCSHGSSLLH